MIFAISDFKACIYQNFLVTLQAKIKCRSNDKTWRHTKVGIEVLQPRKRNK